MSVMKRLGKNKLLSRVAIPIMLVLAIAGSLWFGTPTTTRALQMEITNQPNGYYSVPYMFSVTVTIEQNELLPIQDVSLKITNSVDQQVNATYSGLPVTNGGTFTDANPQTGTVSITAYVSQENQMTGAGYVVWQGQAYSFTPGDYYGPSEITYSVVWTPPASWPSGTYNIDAAIQADATHIFAATTRTFVLGQATMVAMCSLENNVKTVGVEQIAIVQVNINQIIDPTTNQTANLNGGLGGYEAQLVYPSGTIQILGVSGTAATGAVAYIPATGVFSVASMATPLQPSNTTVAEIAVKLMGNATTPDNLAVVFTKIVSANDQNEMAPATGAPQLTFLRGDSSGDGAVAIGDALRIAQFVVGKADLTNTNPVNAASVVNDFAYGDAIKIGDALGIAQYIVGKRDGYFVQ